MVTSKTAGRDYRERRICPCWGSRRNILSDLTDLNAQAAELGDRPAWPRLVIRIFNRCAPHQVVRDVRVCELGRATLNDKAEAASKDPGSLLQT